MNDTVRVNVEHDLDLGDALRCRGDANEVEFDKQLVVPDQLTLTLEDLDLNGGLTVGSSQEGLRLLRRDCGAPGNEFGHNTTESLDPEGEGSDVRQENIITLELEDSGIEGSTTQVVDGHDVFARLVHTVGKGSCGGFVDGTEHVQSSDFSGILGCLSLSVVEVGRNGTEVSLKNSPRGRGMADGLLYEALERGKNGFRCRMRYSGATESWGRGGRWGCFDGGDVS